MRIRSRSDISAFLTHLTRPTETRSSIEVLIEILSQKKLILGSGREGYVIKDKAVCLQDSIAGIILLSPIIH